MNPYNTLSRPEGNSNLEIYYPTLMANQFLNFTIMPYRQTNSWNLLSCLKGKFKYWSLLSRPKASIYHEMHYLALKAIQFLKFTISSQRLFNFQIYYPTSKAIQYSKYVISPQRQFGSFDINLCCFRTNN